jgi:predicted MPP superfamily phosphohydrolase
LRARSDGSFRLLVVSDLHFRPRPDPFGLDLLARLIELEQPGLVLINGDCLSGKDCPTRAALDQAIAHVAGPFERAAVPWAITFGNHDPEHAPASGLDQPAVLGIYEQYPHNRNSGWARGVRGTGNHNLLIYDSAGTRPIFNLWLLDSGNHAASLDASQVEWYLATSRQIEKNHGALVPALMFFHVPPPEFIQMAATSKIIGQRHEPESCADVNAGLFAAVRARGDVRGIFCGHDHENNYVGRLKGIDLGYDGVAGYDTYPHIPPADSANGHVRGGRVFVIRESDPAHYLTWMRFANGSRNWEADSDAYTRDHLK